MTPDVVEQLGAVRIGAFDRAKFAMLMAVPVDYTITPRIAIRFEPGVYVSDFSKTKQEQLPLQRRAVRSGQGISIPTAL